MSEKPISEKELLVAIKDLLKKSGYLNKLNAEVRAKVTSLLQDRQTTGVVSTPPTPTEEVLLVNELVREYLEWNGYLYTASVMMSEAAMPKDKRTRSDLCTEVGVKDDEKSSALPLLSNIVGAYVERIKRKISKSGREVPKWTRACGQRVKGNSLSDHRPCPGRRRVVFHALLKERQQNDGARSQRAKACRGRGTYFHYRDPGHRGF